MAERARPRESQGREASLFGGDSHCAAVQLRAQAPATSAERSSRLSRCALGGTVVTESLPPDSVTYLPVLCSTGWRILSEYELARYLRAGEDRNKRLPSTLGDAVDAGLKLEDVSTCSAETPIDEVLAQSQGKPVLDLDGERTDRLVGIITSFDLL